jgi:hypothetical protein
MRRKPVSVESVVATLSAMERYFQGGKRWGRGKLHNPLNGTKCLVGAVSSVQASSGNRSWVPAAAIAAATYYVERAVRERGGRGMGGMGFMVIEAFNDTRPSFHEIAAVIARAKEMATADARPLPAPPPVAEILPPPPRFALAYQPEEEVVKLSLADLARVALPLRRDG